MKEPLTCRALSPPNPTMLRPFGAARVVMSWRRNRAANELKVDRTKNARVALMISLSWATLPGRGAKFAQPRVALRPAEISRDARPHVGSGRVEPASLAAAAGDEAIDFVAAASAGAPARPKAASAPEAEKIAIGPHGQLLGGEVPIAIFLRFGIWLAAFAHGGFAFIH